MILHFIPTELVKSLVLVAFSLLTMNLLGSYKNKKRLTFNKDKAMQGFYDSLMILGALLLICFAIVYLVPQDLITQEVSIDLVVKTVGAFGVAMLLKNIKQIIEIFTFKEEK